MRVHLDPHTNASRAALQYFVHVNMVSTFAFEPLFDVE